MNKKFRYMLLSALLVSFGLSCQTVEQESIGYGGSAHGSEGHGGHEEGDHGHGHGAGNLAFTLFSQTHELFGEIEPLTAGQPSQYTLHVSRLADNNPTTQGQLELAFYDLATSDRKPVAVATAAKPDRMGIFEFTADSPVAPGSYRISFRYQEAEDESAWDLEAEVKRERIPFPEVEPGPGVVGFTKEQQWRVPFRVELPQRVSVGNQRRTRAVVAEDPAATEVVSAMAGGRVVWDGSTEALIPGRAVTAGELLGHLTATPPPDHVSHLEAEISLTQTRIGAAKADLERIDALETSGLLTAEAKARESAALQTAEAELRRARRELKREEQLVSKGLASAKDLNEAKAEVEKAGAEEARATQELERIEQWKSGRYELAAERVRSEAELERLSTRLDSLTARLEEVLAGGNRVTEIRAHQTGVLVELVVPSGAVVHVGSPLVRVRVRTSVLVEVRALRADRPVLANARSVNLLRSGWDSGRTLNSLGAVKITPAPLYDEETHLHRLIFRVAEAGSLVPGELLDALVSYGEPQSELSVPTTSVVEVSTLPYVFVLLEGEAFERRRVELGPRLGDRIVIRSGLEQKERVVAVGAFDIHVATLTSSLQSHQH